MEEEGERKKKETLSRRAAQGWLGALCVWRACVVAGVAYGAGLDLSPDEAQYWGWAQQLDWGYYSKPPGIAWQIALSTALLGSTPFGVRCSALVMSTAFMGALYRLVRFGGGSRRAGLWGAALAGLTPMGLLGGMLATTDGGLLLFWTLCWGEVARFQRRREPLPWGRLGFLVGAGALFKWPIYLFWPVIGLVKIGEKRRESKEKRESKGGEKQEREESSGWRVLWGGALSLWGLVPSVVWNFSHEWATFRHVFHQSTGGSGGGAGANPLDFLAAQMGLLSPGVWLLLLFAIWGARKRREPLPLGMACLLWSFLLLAGAYHLLSGMQKMQGNWMVFAYPGALAFLSWWRVDQMQEERALGRSLSVGGALVALLLMVPLPYSMQPFRHERGWRELGEQLHALGYRPEAHFLAGEKYQVASELSFYCEGQKRAHFLNLHGARKNQLSFWPGLEKDPLREEGFFVLVEKLPYVGEFWEEIDGRYTKELEQIFSEVERVAVVPLVHLGGRAVKEAAVYHCQGFLGGVPEDPDVY